MTDLLCKALSKFYSIREGKELDVLVEYVEKLSERERSSHYRERVVIGFLSAVSCGSACRYTTRADTQEGEVQKCNLQNNGGGGKGRFYMILCREQNGGSISNLYTKRSKSPPPFPN